ncbi:bacteriocin-like protein [Chryseobacterium oranimense]|jgi:hypothetical protein|uniref:Uncharacterized protein n=1 Tax=Chryseobacterium oranimense TaxID=421058 RepID=A0A1M5VE29_9FLAO|nr:hypothetical protein [Chryseobacterium oranimense]CEJ71233.1 hypothetical protein BN1195_03577 [Chryseobacterium oranimense G311]SHH73507.1 hypothetical protein SAMN05421866_3571 [Chryseobacterium oranimense]
MKNLKKLSREEKSRISGGFTEFQIETCGGAAYVCFRGGGAWGCWRTPGGTCYPPMV